MAVGWGGFSGIGTPKLDADPRRSQL